MRERAAASRVAADSLRAIARLSAERHRSAASASEALHAAEGPANAGRTGSSPGVLLAPVAASGPARRACGKRRKCAAQTCEFHIAVPHVLFERSAASNVEGVGCPPVPLGADGAGVASSVGAPSTSTVGRSLSSDAVSAPLGGRPAARRTCPRAEREWRRRHSRTASDGASVPADRPPSVDSSDWPQHGGIRRQSRSLTDASVPSHPPAHAGGLRGGRSRPTSLDAAPGSGDRGRHPSVRPPAAAVRAARAGGVERAGLGAQ